MIKTHMRWSMLICCLLLAKSMIGQSGMKKEVTKTYLLKNGLVVASPGSNPIKTNILVKDGMIVELGTQKAPFDAKVIDVDSHYIYAGFIDPMSNVGIKKEEEKKDAPKPESRGAATLEQSGVTPQITAISKFLVKDASIADMRKQGFTTSQIFPRGRMLAGSSSIVSLREVSNEDQALIKNNVAIMSSFTPAQGVAPGTIIGVIAKYRDLFKNAELAMKNEATYNLNPVGLKKPVMAKELAALIPVVKKELPLYFVANSSKDIFKAISLQKEYGFKMVLAEVKQSQHALTSIKAGGYPVLLSLDIPDEIKDDKKEEKKEDKKSDTTAVKTKVEKPKKEKSAEEKSLDERKKSSYNEYLAQAANLEKNGIPFSFSYLDVKSSDIHKAIKRFVKAGLSEKSALSALTTTPANMLGISKTTGTIEAGKAANLVISEKSIFDEKSEIKYVFTDGTFNDYAEAKKPTEGKSDGKGINIAGVWSWSVEMPGQKQTGKITFEKDGNSFKGSSISDSAPSNVDDISNVIVEGNKVTFNMTVDMGQPVIVDFNLDFTATDFSGTVGLGVMGSFPIKGSIITPKF
jgi:imidazolonepropionase-like amidohydrolase